jgi:hypothetical protein
MFCVPAAFPVAKISRKRPKTTKNQLKRFKSSFRYFTYENGLFMAELVNFKVVEVAGVEPACF